MERLGAPSHRNRKFTFVDEIEEFAQINTMEGMSFDDQERHLPPLSTVDSDGYTRVMSNKESQVQDSIQGLEFPNSAHNQSNKSLQLKMP